MSSIHSVMSNDHERCDSYFAAAEAAVANARWDEASAKYKDFAEALESHLRVEEDVLFPALEKHMDASMGPTQVMRMEHEQIRSLSRDLAQQIQRQDADDFLGLSETLLTLMQQHNIKEEQVLYRLADQTLVGEHDMLLERMRNIG